MLGTGNLSKYIGPGSWKQNTSTGNVAVNICILVFINFAFLNNQKRFKRGNVTLIGSRSNVFMP